MSALTRLARGQECQIRLPGICNGYPATVVACHFRLSGLSGIGKKPPDIFCAWGCSACHAYVDSHKDAETQLAFAHGCFRTMALLHKRGKL